MNFKKMNVALAGLALSAAIAVPAHAVTLAGGYAGGIHFVYTAFDMGTNYASPTVNGVVCASTAACNTAAIATAPGAIPAGEDTWGIFQVTAIVSNDGNSTLLWTSGTAGEYITGMFHSLTDGYVKGFDDGSVKAYSNGGKVQFYLDNQIADFSVGAGQGAAGRTAVDKFNGATNGTLWLDLEFAGTAATSMPGFSYQSSFDVDSLGGSGTGYLDVVGGSYASTIAKGTETDKANQKRDVYLSAQYSPKSTAPLWTVVADGGVDTNVVPEPASLALLGLGLAGLASLRRRKN